MSGAPAAKRSRTDPSQLSDKKLRRLEKNRESARECRRRKKEHAQNLQRQINRLENENLQLRLQLKIGDEAEKQDEADQLKVSEGLEQMLRSGASESEIWATIEEFKEKYADYGRDRRSSIQFHLEKIERLLRPTTTTTVAMRAIENSSKEDEKAPAATNGEAESTCKSNQKTKTKSLFSLLASYLEIDDEQNQLLNDSRNVAKELDKTYVQSIKLVSELQGRLRQDGADLDQQFMEVAQILNPSQLAKFVIWVQNNPACMHMLNALWQKTFTYELKKDDKADAETDADEGGDEKSDKKVVKSENP
mmetsp:Transcript_1969/g.3949  ORF Transcript_1969/g.3949 Transcript_1969/m.3949 type:complete len:306 (-) Transcript_1969:52-969(-)